MAAVSKVRRSRAASPRPAKAKSVQKTPRPDLFDVELHKDGQYVETLRFWLDERQAKAYCDGYGPEAVIVPAPPAAAPPCGPNEMPVTIEFAVVSIYQDGKHLRTEDGMCRTEAEAMAIEYTRMNRRRGRVAVAASRVVTVAIPRDIVKGGAA